MTTGVMLLSRNNVYLSNEGQLPKRPRWDKTFITDLIKGQRVLCSPETLKTLPASILGAGYFTTDPTNDYDINFGVATFSSAPVDMLFVVRSSSELEGKKFRLDDYVLIHRASPSFEIWRAK